MSEIALVRLSETSDYLLGQVNTPLAVIGRTSGNLQQYFIFHYIKRVLDRAVFPGKYRPGNPALVFPGQHCIHVIEMFAVSSFIVYQ